MDEIQKQAKKYLMNTYGRQELTLVRGEGCYAYDPEGKKYLDLVAGIAVNNLGHCPPKVVKALQKQAEILIHTSNLYYTQPQADLARLLVENSGLDRVFLCNSGAEANEAAIKLARKYGHTVKKIATPEIITAHKSFHGRTLAAVTATGQEKYHKNFEPLVPGFRYVPFDDVESLEKSITPNTCAIMLEPIQGEGGVNVPHQEYFARVRKLCDQQGILLILDEVQTGFGRTGTLFAYEHYGIVPDMMTLAKALGGGVAIGAMMCLEKVNLFQPGDHAATFGGNPLASAAAIAAVEQILEEKLCDYAAELGYFFQKELETLQKKHPSLILSVRGVGLMLAADLPEGLGPKIQKRGIELGVLFNLVGGHTLRFVPPLVITKEEVLKGISALDQILSENS